MATYETQNGGQWYRVEDGVRYPISGPGGSVIGPGISNAPQTPGISAPTNTSSVQSPSADIVDSLTDQPQPTQPTAANPPAQTQPVQQTGPNQIFQTTVDGITLFINALDETAAQAAFQSARSSLGLTGTNPSFTNVTAQAPNALAQAQGQSILVQSVPNGNAVVVPWQQGVSSTDLLSQFLGGTLGSAPDSQVEPEGPATGPNAPLDAPGDAGDGVYQYRTDANGIFFIRAGSRAEADTLAQNLTTTELGGAGQTPEFQAAFNVNDVNEGTFAPYAGALLIDRNGQQYGNVGQGFDLQGFLNAGGQAGETFQPDGVDGILPTPEVASLSGAFRNFLTSEGINPYSPNGNIVQNRLNPLFDTFALDQILRLAGDGTEIADTGRDTIDIVRGNTGGFINALGQGGVTPQLALDSLLALAQASPDASLAQNAQNSDVPLSALALFQGAAPSGEGSGITTGGALENVALEALLTQLPQSVANRYGGALIGSTGRLYEDAQAQAAAQGTNPQSYAAALVAALGLG